MSSASRAKAYAKRAEEASSVEGKLDNVIKAILELVKAIERQ